MGVDRQGVGGGVPAERAEEEQTVRLAEEHVLKTIAPLRDVRGHVRNDRPCHAWHGASLRRGAEEVKQEERARPYQPGAPDKALSALSGSPPGATGPDKLRLSGAPPGCHPDSSGRRLQPCPETFGVKGSRCETPTFPGEMVNQE